MVTQIIVNPSELYNSSPTVYLDGEDVVTISVSAVASVATTIAGTGYIKNVTGVRGLISASNAVASGTHLPADPPRDPPTSAPSFNLPTPSAIRTLEQRTTIKDSEMLPVLLELNKIDGNVANASTNTKAIWSDQVLGDSISADTHRTLIKLKTANYKKMSVRAIPSTPNNRRRF